MTERDVVLVVEDQEDLADLYVRWLEEHYEVRKAYDGEEALELMDDAVDVVLLDRRLPGMSGDDVLKQIRDDGHESPVAMVSAVEPDFDILEMGFNDYVVKPADKDDVLEVVDRLLTVESSSADVQEYFSLMSKKSALEAEKSEFELEESDEYRRIAEAVDGFRNRIVTLSEDCLAKPGKGDGFGKEGVYREALEEWKKREEGLDKYDPLYEAANENIRKYEELLSDDKSENAAELELLKVVKESFVAEGVWLDSRILRALNYIFYDKYDDTFIIERHPLTEDTELESGKMYEVSEAVRRRAEEEIEKIQKVES